MDFFLKPTLPYPQRQGFFLWSKITCFFTHTVCVCVTWILYGVDKTFSCTLYHSTNHSPWQFPLHSLSFYFFRHCSRTTLKNDVPATFFFLFEMKTEHSVCILYRIRARFIWPDYKKIGSKICLKNISLRKRGQFLFGFDCVCVIVFIYFYCTSTHILCMLMSPLFLLSIRILFEV